MTENDQCTALQSCLSGPIMTIDENPSGTIGQIILTSVQVISSVNRPHEVGDGPGALAYYSDP
jgi:hypothetical protein